MAEDSKISMSTPCDFRAMFCPIIRKRLLAPSWDVHVDKLYVLERHI